MAVELIERQYTTRTYPRLMKDRKTCFIAMALHDHVGGIVWLSGPDAGKTVNGVSVKWEHFDDYVGSVTLHNSD
jgi:hypothetical protein